MSFFHIPILILVGALSFQSWQLLFGQFTLASQIFWFAGGAAAALFYSLFFNRSQNWDTFWHEITHLLWAKLFRSKIHKFTVDRSRGGEVQFENVSKWARAFVVLAPYFFPTFPLLLVIFKKLVSAEFQLFFDFLIGLNLAIFYLDMLKTLRVQQPDIVQCGYLYSFVFIIIMHSFFLTIIAISLLDQHAFMEYYTIAFVNIIQSLPNQIIQMMPWLQEIGTS